MSLPQLPLNEVVHEGFNNEIWTNESQRPRDYADLNWVRASSLLHPVLELASPESDATLLDIGTGTGAIISYMAPHVGFAVGIDISRAMMSQVAKEYTNVALIQGDVRNNVPLPDAVADVVTTRMMLHDLEEPEAAIAEAWRIVKPGGRMVAAEYVIELASPDAVIWTDLFEDGRNESALVPSMNFSLPSVGVIEMHKELFELKREPKRHLWSGEDVKNLFSAACSDVERIQLGFSMTPYNSVGNWLGKSGFGLEVKQAGIAKCLAIDTAIKKEIDMLVTLNGEPMGSDTHDWILAAYEAMGSAGREALGIDVGIHRVFANVMVEKKQR